jgi:hypothetical protein
MARLRWGTATSRSTNRGTTSSFDNEGDFPLVLRDPFADAQEEALLHWYFEEYLRLPF